MYAFNLKSNEFIKEIDIFGFDYNKIPFINCYINKLNNDCRDYETRYIITNYNGSLWKSFRIHSDEHIIKPRFSRKYQKGFHRAKNYACFTVLPFVN